MPGFFYLAYRFSLAGLFLYFFARKKWQKQSWKTYAIVLAIAAFGMGVSNLLYVEGARQTPLFIMGIIGSLTPVMIYVLAALIHKERMKKSVKIAAAISFFGSSLIVLGQGTTSSAIVSPVGPLLMLSAGFLVALKLVLSKKALSHIPADQYTVLQFAGGALPFIAFIFVHGNLFNILDLPLKSLGIFFLLCTTNGALVFFLFNKGVKNAKLSLVAQQCYLELIVVGLVSFVLLHEKLSILSLIGCGLVIVGTLLGQKHFSLVSMLHYGEYGAQHVLAALKNPEQCILHLAHAPIAVTEQFVARTVALTKDQFGQIGKK
jgi:drug/metabolite transporter (DMT)-like permease